jgi:hypothetical protein
VRETRAKAIVIGEVLLLLVPLTLFTVLLFMLSYLAYPLPQLKPLQVIFDAGMLFKTAGIVAAWYLATLYWRSGRRGLRHVSPVWVLLIIIAAAVGFASALVGLDQWLSELLPSETVGFALLAPAVALLPLALHFSRARRHSLTGG